MPTAIPNPVPIPTAVLNRSPAITLLGVLSQRQRPVTIHPVVRSRSPNIIRPVVSSLQQFAIGK